MMAKQWPDISQMTCLSWMVLCYASQRDSLAYLAWFTQWQLTNICCKPWTWLIKKRHSDKDRQANRQCVPLWANFCRRILRCCNAEEEISYVYRSAPANSWHLPNTPSTKKEKKEEKWWKQVAHTFMRERFLIAQSEQQTQDRFNNVSHTWIVSLTK